MTTFVQTILGRLGRRWHVVLIVATLAALLPVTTPRPAAAADPVAPQFLRDIADLRGLVEDADVWTVGGGFLYWARCNLAGPNLAGAAEGEGAAEGAGIAGDASAAGGESTLAATSYLRRWPLRGGRAATIALGNFCVQPSLAADDTGLYYYDSVARQIIFRAATNPYTARTVASSQLPSGTIQLDQGDGFVGDYIYWLENGAIRNARKSDFKAMGQPEPLGAGASNLTTDGNYLVYFAGGQIYSLLKYCLAIGGGACIKTPLVAAQGNYLMHAALVEPIYNSRISPFWVNGANIQGYWCLSGSCQATIAYTGPNVGGVAYAPGKLVSDGNFMFWVENQCFPLGGFGGCSYGQGGRLMKWNLNQYDFGNPFNSPQQIACRNCGATYAIADDGAQIAVADGWVYFKSSAGITRTRADAPPITWDLAVAALEVTQGVQGLNNDVPLVADKPTFVRLYGRKLSGPNAQSVDALLYGRTPGGAPLPGSPLRPVNGLQGLTANNAPLGRGDPNASWIFQLPAAWVRSGAIRLSPQVDPAGAWSDPNLANNTQADTTFTFIKKAPICIVFIPVRTSPRVQLFTPEHWFAIEMTKRLLPTPDVWVYSQGEDVAELEARFGIPPWKYGPYEMGEGGSLGNGVLSDSAKVISSLWARDQLSDDPDRCDDARARTHYVGVVSADAGGNNGSGRLGGDQLWFRVPPADFSRDWMTDRAVTLAHELGHNYGRRHVDCPLGNPEDVGGYPYPTCQIDFDDNLERHYGFTYNPFRSAFEAIAPTTAGDLMSYAHQLSPARPRWTSDFTWRGMLNEVPNGAAALAANGAPAAPNLAAADTLVMISGVINTAAPASAALDHAWVLPAATLSARMVEKWQRTAAPAVSAAAALAEGSYHLRLLDAGGALLDDRALTLDDHADDLGSTQSFQLTFPAPAGQVARIELADGPTVLATLAPGAAAPTVSIVAPAGGETFDDQLTLAWRGADADSGDRLLYTVQYSPDSGQTWRVVLAGFPNLGDSDTVTVPLSSLDSLPASTTGGLIRVLASDGYNTTAAVSQPFSIPNRGPRATITAPWAGQSIPAGQTITLQGAAVDAEDGSLSGEALRWSVDGVPAGTGAAQLVGGLAPGEHTVALTARDAAGAEQTVSLTLTVEALRIPIGAAPTLDGECGDAAYTGAPTLRLAPYANGAQPVAQLVRSDAHLWVCFSNLARAGGSSAGSAVAIYTDGNHSRDERPQTDDYAFVVGEDGVVIAYAGTGTTPSYSEAGPGGLAGRTSATASAWQAELRIDAAVLGGWNTIIGLAAEHVAITTPTDAYDWPFAANGNRPAGWATTALGDLPRLSGLAPGAATAGDGPLTLTVDGANFAADSVVRWGGADRPTTFVSATQLQASIGAGDLATSGVVAVTVASPATGAAASNALPFFVGAAPVAAPGAFEQRVMLPFVRR